MRNWSTRRQLVGTVISDKMNKTVVVLVEKLTKHSMYKKYVRRRSKFVAHDSNNRCNEGDRVLIIESRPLSKTKKWRVSKVVEKTI